MSSFSSSTSNNISTSTSTSIKTRHLPPPYSSSQKLGSFKRHRRCNSASSSLTEDSYDRRQDDALIPQPDHQNNVKVIDYCANNRKSPYYNGLIDPTLLFRHPSSSSISSPGRRSSGYASTNSSTSLVSIILKLRELSSCLSFSFKRRSIDKTKVDKDDYGLSAPDINHSPPVQHSRCLSSPPPPPSSSSAPSANSCVSKKMDDNYYKDFSFVNFQKPLRETAQSQPKPSPITQAFAATTNQDYAQEKGTTTTTPTEKEIVWANKYRPKRLTDFICNRDKAIQLQALMKDVDCSHFIFEGPAGVGKKTMIWAMLQEAFGSDKLQTKEELKVFKLKGEAIGSIEVRVKVSSQHLEVNLSDVGEYEKHVIFELIKGTDDKAPDKALKSRVDRCRAIILYEADKLSADGLFYIKWLLERYKGVTKFFFCCGDASRLQPIKTLCNVVQLFPPSSEEIAQVLEFIAKQESIELPRQLAEKIAAKAKNNLRQAIRSFEASWEISNSFIEDEVILTGWEDDIANIAKKMVEEQSPRQLYIIRGKLRNLIEHDVSPDFIFESLFGELKKHVDESTKPKIESLYRQYSIVDGNMLDGDQNRREDVGIQFNDPARKEVHHFMRIEEFIAKFMSFYKSSSTNSGSIQRENGS
ncbi:hypothetical protein K2173_024379 [Erythroxylum novogranatense]|uniref:Uncharacterized protein n=1 Tax=Erythroxylum novogranatense TaxID=1862640 RepID=A0AAV8SVE7_9ROSI|nr:hypothetical protein K2173_024379 [Erythroxylum novogranatense]